MEKVTSRAKLKIVQLEAWLRPARLGLITSQYYVHVIESTITIWEQIFQPQGNKILRDWTI